MNVERRTLNCISPKNPKGQAPSAISPPHNNPAPEDDSLLSSGDPSDLREECSKCGGHTIIDDTEYIPGIGREKYKKCHSCGSRNIIKVPAGHHATSEGKSPLPPAANNIAAEEPRTEETMEKDKKKDCSVNGCTKYGSFDGMCAKHFGEIHGISYSDFLRRRKAGESKEEILASPEKPVNRQSSIMNSGKKPAKAETKPANTKEFNTGDLVAVKKSKSSVAPLKKDLKDYQEFEKVSSFVTIDLNSGPVTITNLADIAAETARRMSPADQIMFLLSRSATSNVQRPTSNDSQVA